MPKTQVNRPDQMTGQYVLFPASFALLDNFLPKVNAGDSQVHAVFVHPSAIQNIHPKDAVFKIANQSVSSVTIPVLFLWVTLSSLRLAKLVTLLTAPLTSLSLLNSTVRRLMQRGLTTVLRRFVNLGHEIVSDPSFLLKSPFGSNVVNEIGIQQLFLTSHFVFPGEGPYESIRQFLGGAEITKLLGNLDPKIKVTGSFPFNMQVPASTSSSFFLERPRNPRHTCEWLEFVKSFDESHPARPKKFALLISRPVDKSLNFRLSELGRKVVFEEVFRAASDANLILLVKRHPHETGELPLPIHLKNVAWLETHDHVLSLIDGAEIVFTTVSSLGADAAWLGVPCISFIPWPIMQKEQSRSLSLPRNSLGSPLYSGPSLAGFEIATSDASQIQAAMYFALKSRENFVDQAKENYERFFVGSG